MKYLLAASLLCAAGAAHAQVPLPRDGVAAFMAEVQAAAAAMQRVSAAASTNEAVRTLPGGMRVVEEPPGPRSDFGRPPPMPAEAWDSGAGLPGYVIETRTGRVECLQPWLEKKNCRPYQPGAEQRLRAWVVKRGGQWLKCPRQDSAQCVGYYSFPLTEVQE